MTSITVRATEDIGIGKKEAERAKNMFALGLVSWMFGRPTETTLNWLEKKFGSRQEILDANVAAFKAGYNFGETTELFAESYKVDAAPAGAREPTGTSRARRRSRGAWSRRPSGAASRSSTRAIRSPRRRSSSTSSRGTRTSASITIQAEDEIAAANIALGAAFSGQLARDRDERARHRPQGRDHRARGDHGAADDRRGRAAGRPVHRACPRRPSRRTSCWRCTAATGSRRCRSCPRPRPPSASRPRSRRRGSRCATGRR